MIDIRLKVFRSVALNLSFTKAAQELFISQPAISKHVSELESEFNTRLVNRQGNRISLTSDGQVLLDHCEKIIKEYQKLDYDMNALRNRFQGELRIGASTTIAQYVLPEILSKFIAKYPQFKINMFSGNSCEVENAILNDRVDVGMVEGVIRQPQLQYSAFMKDELVAIVASGSNYADMDEVTVRQLKDIPIVLRERGSGTLDVIERALKGKKMQLSDMNVLMYFGTTEGIKHFVESSDCMGIVSVRAVSRELVNGIFKVIDIKDLVISRIFSFAEKRGETSGPQRLLKQFITDNYRL